MCKGDGLVYKYFVRPVGIILGIYFLSALSVASDIAQLTSFNLLNFVKSYSPQSYYLIIVGTIFLYLLLVARQFIRSMRDQQNATHRNSGQIINARNIKKSTIIQVKKD